MKQFNPILVVALLLMPRYFDNLVDAIAKPLEPSCHYEKDKCEFKLVANYMLTMTVHVPAAGPQWSPVTARPDGLWSKGGKIDCSILHQKLSPEESEHVVIGDGTHRMVFAINGSVPGPPLVVYEGQQIVVHYTNNLENEGSILHFHGMHQRGTPWMDGTNVAQCPIHPGETFTYRFTASPAGTFWYHAHYGSTSTMGLYGAFIVLPNPALSTYRPRNDLPVFKAEYSVFVSDWLERSSAEIGLYRRKNLGMYGFGLDNDLCYNVTLQADKAFCAHWPFNSAIINGKGRHYKYDGFIPDNPNIPLEVFTVKKGHKYYFRMTCSSLELSLSISIDRHPLHVVATDGSDIVTQIVDVIIISPGERYDFFINAADPDRTGNYWMRAVSLELYQGSWIPMAPHHVSAVVRYEGAPEKDPMSKRRDCTELRPCRVLNCPFKEYPDPFRMHCVALDELRALQPDYTNWQVPESEVLEFFLQMQSIDIPGGHGRQPSVNGVRHQWPHYPAQVYKEDVANKIDQCDLEACSDGCQCTYFLKIPLGKVVNMVITNNAAIDVLKVTPHPTHLHGYTPQLVKMGWAQYDPDTMRLIGGNDEIICKSLLCNDGAMWANASWRGGNIPGLLGPSAPKKDTVNLASGGYAVWRFKADNPGYWILHCHIEFHLTDGMAVILQVGEPEDMPPAPARMARCGDFQLEEEEYHAAVNSIGQKFPPGEHLYIPESTPATVVIEIDKSASSLRSFQSITIVLVTVCLCLTVALVLLYQKYSAQEYKALPLKGDRTPLMLD